MPANLLNACSVHAPGRSVNVVTVSAAGALCTRLASLAVFTPPSCSQGRAGTSAWNGVCNGFGILPGGRADAGHPGLVAGAQGLDPVAQVFQSLQGLLEGLHRLLACLFGGCSLTSVASPELGEVGHRRSFELGAGLSATPTPTRSPLQEGLPIGTTSRGGARSPTESRWATSLTRGGPGANVESTAPGRQGEEPPVPLGTALERAEDRSSARLEPRAWVLAAQDGQLVTRTRISTFLASADRQPAPPNSGTRRSAR